MAFKMDDYVDVAERIRQFSERYPSGSLQSEATRLEAGWLCKAYAYRDPDDPRPGVGHAFEPVPGKTPYTKDSELMNAETSAWGRAIVALGFNTKKIASAQEVKARQKDSALPPVGDLAVTGSASVPGDPVRGGAPNNSERDRLVDEIAAASDPSKLVAQMTAIEASEKKRTPAEHLEWLRKQHARIVGDGRPSSFEEKANEAIRRKNELERGGSAQGAAA